MKYGLSCNSLLGPAPAAADLIRCVQEAERIGFHSIVVSDHVIMPSHFDASSYPAGVFDGGTPWYDPLVLLAALAGFTKTIRLGTGVMVVPYHPPIQQAQAIATLDFISNGRFFYGVGVGWMAEEFETLAVPYRVRGARTDEYIEVMKLLWSGSGDAYHGQFIAFEGGHINPLPTQKPHPPILIGGQTPPAFRRMARLGDGFYINWKSFPEYSTMLEQIGSHMAKAGRDISGLYKQLGASDIDLVREQRENLPRYEALGLDEIIYSPRCDSVDEGFTIMRSFADEFF